MKRTATATLTVLLASQVVLGGDWPMHRYNAARNGSTADPLPAKLSLRWTYQARHAPMPAWPITSRLPFDRAYHPVIANGTLYFGSSADGKIYALDAATGKPRWSVFTDGPIRFAPALWKDRVLVAGDDGMLYCLSAADGGVVWKRRGGPDDRMVLGNGRMISRWPVRGGPVVIDDVVYVGAGIWPTDGIYLYALDAATGKVRWCNDQAGYIFMSQPHPGAEAKSGVSAHGHLAVAGDRLVVPTGRAVPAVFDRTDAKLEYFHLQRYRAYGGTPVAVIDEYLFNGKQAYRIKDGDVVSEAFRATSVAPAGDEVICGTDKGIFALDRAKKFVPKTVKRDKKEIVVPTPNTQWRLAVPGGAATALIVADRTAVCASPNHVTTVNLDARQVQWSTSVKGNPHGLAVADARLYVSTDQGMIYCFDGEKTSLPTTIRPPTGPPDDEEDAVYATAAEEIVRKTGVTEGYCIDLACGDGRLARALARRTKLRICAVDADTAQVQRARQRLEAAGLYGVRVTVHRRDPAGTNYPKWFADLVVSGRSVREGPSIVPTGEAARLQRPYGGIVCVGKPGAMTKAVRGPIAGAGEWTHQYCNPANTGCSADTVVKGPLGILWFDSPDLRTPNRHGRSPAPLFMDGRLFVAGLDAIRAMNPYNGRVLWEFSVPGLGRPYHQEHLMGVAGTNSRFCAALGSVYVGDGPRCRRIDAATGKLIAEFKAPPRPNGRPGKWGYIACDGGLLFGTLVNDNHLVPYRYGKSDMRTQFTESVCLFVLDAETGRPKWMFSPRQSIRHNAIAVGGGRVYLIDRALAFEPPRRSRETRPHPTGELVALDARTGKVLWRDVEDVYGTVLELSVKHDVLLMCYQPTRFRLGSETGGKFRAYHASKGKRLWERSEQYISRPLINDRTIYAQPGAWDLLTGEPKQQTDPKSDEDQRWQFTRSYGCGIVSGSRNLLLFRSATLGYVDLLRNRGTENYGGIRPGCWINTLPVGGLVIMPDTTNVCSCSYLNKASIGLQTME